MGLHPRRNYCSCRKLYGFLDDKNINRKIYFENMSNVHLFVVKDDCVYLLNVHYRTAKRLLESGVEKVLPKLRPRFLDAGYIVVDLNKKILVNGQNGFAMPLVNKKGMTSLNLER